MTRLHNHVVIARCTVVSLGTVTFDICFSMLYCRQVLKEIRAKHTWEAVLQSAQASGFAQDCLEHFRAALEQHQSHLSPELRAALSEVSYALAEPVQIAFGGQVRFFLMEPMLQGDFYKINSNRFDGKGFRAEVSNSTDQLDIMTVIGQAMSCYLYCQFTESAALCSDVQGKGTTLFDPAWITPVPRGAVAGAIVPFGLGNVGNLTIKKFFEMHNHEHNPICQSLQTVTPNPASFLFANLCFVVDLKNTRDKTQTRSRIVEYGGQCINVPSRKQVCIALP
jgi:hypothetical protein